MFFEDVTVVQEGVPVRSLSAVEMKEAALCAFGRERGQGVLCFAYVTNQMGQAENFEKGEANGATASFALAHAVAAQPVVGKRGRTFKDTGCSANSCTHRCYCSLPPRPSQRHPPGAAATSSRHEGSLEAGAILTVAQV